MSLPLVSVVMPAYNAERFIESAVQSVVNQTFQNWELIIVNDCSTDGTAALVRNLSTREPRIKFLEQLRGMQGKARNHGIKISRGEYIAFLDADDLWLKDRLEIQICEIENSRSVDLVFSQGYQIDDDGTLNQFDVTIKSTWDKDDLPQFLEFNQIPILSVMVKKQSLLTVGCFDESFEIQNVEDYHLWLKLLINDFKFRSIPDRLFYYRVHRGQSTYKNKNIATQTFFAFKSIYLNCNDLNVRKAVINKLKWYIFTTKYYQECVAIATYHFERSGKTLLSFVVCKLLSSRSMISQKILFRLLTMYG